MFGMVLGSMFPAFAAGGQTGNVQGTIVDAKTGLPVGGVVVNIVSPTGSAKVTTDSKGFFSVLGLNVDTYTISLQAKGYDDQSVTGVTVEGDQTVNLGTLKISKSLITIGTVRARAPSSVFQPTQTTDQYTVSGNRILQTEGKAAATDETALVQAVPGVSLTNTDNITIRGGLRTEVGYQLDGVDFTEPFFSNNASNNRINGLGSVQVVEGAGDATQGNEGAGVVNLVPKRGTYPGTGLVDFEAGGPNFFHQFDIEYGFATANGRFSDYFSYNGQRDNPYNGYPGANAAGYNNFFAPSYEANDDLLNNFVFKFGHNNSQSLQILYETRDLQQWGDYGGVGLTSWYYNDPANPIATFGFTPAEYQRLIGLNQGIQLGYSPTAPEQISSNPTRFLKFEYDNNLDPNTFLQLRYYNWETLQISQDNTGSSSATPVSLGLGAYPTWNSTGGPRVGGTLDLTHQFGSKNTITLSTKYETAHPIWDGDDPNALAFLLAATGQLADFLPTSACSGCGYLQKEFGGNYANVPRIPISGINYNGAWYQTFGIGLRWQYQPTNKLKFDLGAREDGQNQNFGINPFNPYDNGNPSDVAPANLARKYLNPREVEPRAAVNYEIDRNDAVTFTYGRSTEFLNAQTSGTPGGMYNYQPFLNIPATDTAAAPACGTHFGGYFKCQNYAQQLYWLYDQNFDAPDLGGALPALYSNYDFSYQKQFAGGYAFKLTPFYRLGVDVPSFALVTSLAAGAAVFTANNQGISRTSGVEFGFNTPERPVGFSGFLSATYQNVLSTTPPLIGGEDSLPINGSGSLILGDVYRAGYVSPLVVRVGGEYKTHNGFRVSPVVEYDRGYPFNVGNTIASGSEIDGVFQNIPQVNFGPGVTQIPGFQAQTGTAVSTNYYDPSFSGTSQNPNIAATRGTPGTSSSGGALYKPNVFANLTLEYKLNRNTFGAQILNLGGNSYNNVIPIVNPYYQPVATGLSGPQTGVNPYAPATTGRQLSNAFANVPHDAYAYTNGAYLLIPSRPLTYTIYYQLGL
jgi:hypothetical protein